MRSKLLAIAAGSLLALPALAATPTDITASRQTAASKQARAGEAEFRALYRELVEMNTTLSVGSCTDAANAMKARLLAAGMGLEFMDTPAAAHLYNVLTAEGRRLACGLIAI